MLTRLGRTILAAIALLVSTLSWAQVGPIKAEASYRQADGKLVVAGQSTSGSIPGLAIAVWRLNADGSVDEGFGGGGMTEFAASASSESRVTAVTVQSDGRIVVAYMRDGLVAFMRFESVGAIDSSFGSNPYGIVTDADSSQLRINSLHQDVNGKLVGGGSYGNEVALVRYSANGERDATFGSNPAAPGILQLGGGGGELRALVAMGAGYAAVGWLGSAANNILWVSRHLADGAFDPAFNYGSPLVLWGGGSNTGARAATLDLSGNIVAVGGTGADVWSPGAKFTWHRITPAGMVVESGTREFQVDGMPAPSIARAVERLPNGDVLVAGDAAPLYGYSRLAYTTLAGGETRVSPGANWGYPGDTLTNVIQTADGFFGVGTRGGVALLRERYFLDPMTYDTDFFTSYSDTPRPFSFAPVQGVQPGSVQTSSPARIVGITVPVPISVQGGTYSIGCVEPYTADPGTVYNGQRVCLRMTSGSGGGDTVTATLSVGPYTPVQASFSVTSVGPPQTIFGPNNTGGFENVVPPNPSTNNVMFYFSGDTVSGPISHYECRLDGAPWQACAAGTGGFPYPHTHFWADTGLHTYEVRAVNAYGPDPTPASYTWWVEGPPTVYFTSGPPPYTRETSATIAFTGTAGASFSCAMAGSPFSPCTSPATVTGLADGVQTFAVQASTPSGTSSNSIMWTVDTQAPDGRVISGPPAVTNQPNATFYFGATENSSFECSLDGGAWSYCYDAPFEVTVAEGTHTLLVRAIDYAGNVDATPASYTWTYDATPPDTQITDGPTGVVNTATVSFNYSSPDPSVVSFECRVDAASWSACNTRPASVTVAEGAHTFEVRARDPAGNVDATPSSRTWTYDAPPPDTTITQVFPALPGLPTKINSLTVYFVSDVNGATFECRLDESAWAACTSPKTYASVPDGVRVVSVRALKGAKVDATPASQAWTVDTVAPSVTIMSGPGLTNATSATFTFSSNDPTASFNCRINGGALRWCGAGGNATYTFDNIAAGPNQLSVYASDDALNGSVVQYWSWTVDRTAPTAAISGGPTGTVPATSANFTLSSDDTAATFVCSLDLGAEVPCASPASYSGLGQGNHSLSVRARDAAGNYSQPATRAWVVDFTPPETTLDSKPDAATASASAVFTWASNETGVTYEYRLDGESWVATTSGTRSYAGLAAGSHAFDVRAIDAGGNVDPSPASWSWVIDQTLPDTTISSGPAPTSTSTTATFAFSAEAGSTFTCALDAAPGTPCNSPVTYSGLADGSHTFSVLARDAAGNVEAQAAQWAWTIDATSPETAITAGPSGTVSTSSASFSFSSPDATATFECSLDAAAFSACTSGIAYSGLAQGMHMFEVRARDGAGNVDASPATRTWSVDTLAPATSITSGPQAVSNSASATLVFSSTEAGTFQCKLDAAAYSACTSPVSLAGLSSGAHTFSVYAVDAAGNPDASPATWSWAVDLATPETTITSGPSGTVTQSSATFAFSSSESGTFECRLDGAAFAACTSPTAYSGLADGAHSFEVRAIDAAGNLDPTPAARTWTVDVNAPETSITASPPAVTNATGASFSFTSSEEGSTFQCKLDAGAYAACTSPKTYSGLGQGSHTFSVRATDAVGHLDASPAAFTWTIDTSAPNTTITAGPSGSNNVNPVTFTFTSSEANSTFECKLDTAAFAACASPMTYTGLAVGSHTFQVRARDAAGNVDNSPVSRNFGIK